MSATWIALMVMAMVAAACLCWPLRSRAPVARHADHALEVYRDQLAEIERDRERGLLREAEAKAARTEIERRILKVAGELRPPLQASRPGRAIAFAGAIAVPLLAVMVYLGLGAPHLPDQPIALRERPQDPLGPDIAAMVAGLEARLAAAPDDAQGWQMLGRSRLVLREPEAAVRAYRRAVELAPQSAEAVGGLAEALVTAAGGVVTPDARDLFARLAELAPADPRAPYFLGLAEQQAGAPYEALRIWHGLLAQSPADAPWRAEVEAAVRMAARDVGADAEAIIASARIAPAERPAGDGLPADLAAMIERLAARLEAGEGDAEGWRLLAQSRLATGEVEKARAAFARAAELAPDDPEILKGWAVAHLGPPVPPSGLPAVDERAEALFAQAQALAPDDPEPAWYLGIRALQEGDVEAARDRWREVLARLGPSHPDYAAVRQQLDAIGG